MSISIVIPNYNGSSLLKKNIPSVIAALKLYCVKTRNKGEIIVIDDYSSDDSIATAEAYSANKEVTVRVIRKEKNEGFSSTVNAGVSHAAGDVVVLLNTDVSPKEDFLIPLIRHFEIPEVFAVGCVDESHENGKIVLRGRGVGHFEKGFLKHKKGDLVSNNTLWVSGGSSAFRRDMWERLGGMDTIYNPFYWEDIDLSYRALKAGYSIFIEEKSRVTHAHSEGIIKKTFTEAFVKQIAYRNQILFVWKNITDSSLLLDHLMWMPIHFLRALIRGDGIFLRGCFKAIILLPKVLMRRSRVKQFFVRGDKGILVTFSEPS